MAVVVEGISVAVREVVAVDVVHVAVAVVVQAVVGDLAGVGPHVGHEVGVRVVDTRVDHSDLEVRVAGEDVPGLHGVNVGARSPARLPGVVEAPKIGEPLVVRRPLDAQLVIGLGVLDPGTAPEAVDRLLHGDPRAELDALGN